MGVLWLNFRCLLLEAELECKIMWRNLSVYLLNDSTILYMFNFVDIIFDMESLSVVLSMSHCLHRKNFLIGCQEIRNKVNTVAIQEKNHHTHTPKDWLNTLSEN